MKSFLFIVSMFALAWTVQAEAKEYSCKVVTSYGTAIGKGLTPKAALEAARFNCGSMLIDLHLRKYETINDDRIDDLVLACIDLECE